MQTKQVIERWGMFELTLLGPSTGNPYKDVNLQAVFRYNGREQTITGFYDGDGIYKIRFMPNVVGEWTYQTISNASELAGQVGSFTCSEPSAGNHGPVQVKNEQQFVYADGTSYFPFGTTCYAWTHQPEALQQQTLRTLQSSPFNKIRMCIFPKNYSFNKEETVLFPFNGSETDGFDWTTFNPQFFALLEERLLELQQMGIEADLILFHPYDKGRWGFDRMDADTDDFYLKYVLARLGAFRNVWWSLANEYDFMKEKTMADWDRLFLIVRENDPYVHLRSIHNGTKMYDHQSIKFYDHTHPWVTHCSIQHWDVTLAAIWRNQFKKPIVIDECCYEGNVPQRWGNVSGQEMVRRVWDGVTRGAFVTHGETYVHPEDEIWWAKGGSLYGESPERINYLRQILAEAPKNYTVMPHIYDVPTIGIEGEYYLQYYGLHQPLYRTIELPEDATFRIEVIDTWGMNVVSNEEGMSGTCRIKVGGVGDRAVRIVKMK
ncbi:DUF5060 domain-containing protein [Paenibacillus yanchengensis]|uniref:DUF5060 domain-containing protein n=1 Tax=Paenibacillus yanchengensis TaxID=2035833 RepID=A0ABW4YPI1_9BACL